MRERVPARPSDSVDLSDTLELLASLTQYAEAGAVQPHTLAQAAQHALEEHGDHVDVLLAVSKLYLATGERGEAGHLLLRAARIAPDDNRIPQLLADAGIDAPRRADPPVQPAPRSTGQRAQLAPQTPRSTAARTDPAPPIAPRSAGQRATSAPQTPRSAAPRSAFPPRATIEPTSGLRPVEDEGRGRSRPPTPTPEPPVSAAVERRGRGDATLRSLSEIVPRDASEAPRVPDTTPPATPRSVPGDGPILRPTVRMARVTAAPDRGRWGKPPEPREPLDSRPDRETPSSDGPSSQRPKAEPKADPRPPQSLRSPYAQAAATRSARAAAGNLKLLDPNDERRRLDRYELIGEIAAGGMASVFLARAAGVAGFQRFFAIKRLHPHLADEQEFIDMFLDEARLAAGIHHPNVVPILEVGTTDAGYYLVMDYIEGDTLSGVLSRAAAVDGLPRPIALRVLLDALHGLHAAHELTDQHGHPVDLVHRDCSPQNILVGIDGSSRLTDFGVARASSRLSTTRSATVKGKLAYLSPEQATGRDLDRRSDLFGMGVILWEVLAGRRLFRADTDGATLSRILVEPIPSLAEHAPDLPVQVADVVMKALARDPADRYATAADMADALEQVVRDTGDRDLFIASPRDVAAYMRELFGPDVAARRDAVRAWIAQCTDGDAASGPRSQGLRRASGPQSTRANRPAPRGDSLPPTEEGSSRTSDPVSSGNEPPSSKTEPSAVHSEEEIAAARDAEKQRATVDVQREPASAEPVNADATMPAAGSPIKAEAVLDAKTSDPDPEAPLAAAPPPALPARRKELPIPLIVFAVVLMVLALATYLSAKRAQRPPGAPAPAAATAT